LLFDLWSALVSNSLVLRFVRANFRKISRRYCLDHDHDLMITTTTNDLIGEMILPTTRR